MSLPFPEVPDEGRERKHIVHVYDGESLGTRCEVGPDEGTGPVTFF